MIYILKNPITGYGNPKHICTKNSSNKLMNETLFRLKLRIDVNTMVVGYFHIPLSPRDRSSGRKTTLDREALEVNEIINQTDNRYLQYFPLKQ